MTYTTSQAGVNISTGHTTVKPFSNEIDSLDVENPDEQSVVQSGNVDVNTDYTR